MNASITNRTGRTRSRSRLSRGAGRDFRASRLPESSLRTFALGATITSTLR
jgi:hypothetical protein